MEDLSIQQRLSEQPELLITVRMTAREALAVDLATTYYLLHCQQTSQVYDTAKVLLEQFQKRINQQMSCDERPPMRH